MGLRLFSWKGRLSTGAGLAGCLVLCGFLSAPVPAPRLPSDALPVPIVRQATNYSCGAAALLSVLYYWGVYDEPESDLYPLLKTSTQDGTDPREILPVAEKLGLTGMMRLGVTLDELRAALRRGETPILDIQAWSGEEDTPWPDTWEDGHFVVLVAMDRTYAYFMDPVVGTGYAYLRLDDLEARWHDYETTNGVVWKNVHLAIFLQGKKPQSEFPGPLSPIQ